MQSLPKPSGWITAYRGTPVEISDDESSFSPKRRKLSDLVAERHKSRVKGSTTSSSAHISNSDHELSDVDIIDLTETVSPASRANPSPLVPIPRQQHHHHNGHSSRAVLTPQPTLVASDDELLLSDSDDDSVKTSNGEMGGGLKRLKRSSHSIQQQELRKEPVRKRVEEMKVEVKRPATRSRPSVALFGRLGMIGHDGDDEEEEEDAWSDDNEGDDGDDYEDMSLKFERVFSAVERIASALQSELARCASKTTTASSTSQQSTEKKPLKAVISQPRSLARDLKDYQLVGLNWLRILHLRSLNGILADEMGLGKTIQTIALLAWLQEMRQQYIAEKASDLKSEALKTSTTSRSATSTAATSTSATSTSAPLLPPLHDSSRDHSHFSDAHNDWPTLIVAPASTIENWKRELHTWAPGLRVLVFHGSQFEREEMKDSIKIQWRRHHAHSFDVIISTYQLVGGKHDSGFFKNALRFNYLVVDEAQMLKGKNTARYTQLMQIRAVHRLMLTGTPLQNNLDELQALLGFLMPTLFGKLLEVSLLRELTELSKQGKKVTESEYVLKLKKLLAPFVLRRLKSQVGLGLLPKIYHTISVQPTDIQRRLNQQLFEMTSASLRQSALGSSSFTEDSPTNTTATPTTTTSSTTSTANMSPIDLDSEDSIDATTIQDEDLSSSSATASTIISTTIATPTIDNNTDNYHYHDNENTSSVVPSTTMSTTGNSESNLAVANVLMQLRKSANHPIFVRAFYSTSQIKEMAKVLFDRKHKSFRSYSLSEIETDLELTSDWILHQLALQYPASLKHLVLSQEQLFETSGKFQVLSELLPRLQQESHRVVLFSQFTMVLDVLEQLLQQKLNMGYKRLDGSTSVADRQTIMDEFNENVDNEYFIFLASTLAGGLGVNLTSADTVIFFDISFNPHVDKQAEDRCHRLGQGKQVTIYRLIVPGTIEEHMHRMATAKTELNDIMLNEGSYADQEACDETDGAEVAEIDDDEGLGNNKKKKKKVDKQRLTNAKKVEMLFMKQVALSMTVSQET